MQVCRVHSRRSVRLEQGGCGVRFHRAVGSPLDSLGTGGEGPGQVLEQGDQIWQLYGAGLEGKEENQKPPAVVPEGTPSLTPGAGGGECWGSRHSRKV